MKRLFGILVAVAVIVLPVQAAGQEAAPATSEDAAPAAGQAGKLARAVFTTEIRDREPVDEIQSVGRDIAKVFFYTELQGMEGQTVTHRWSYQGEVKAEITFYVRAWRWRVYSSKNLVREWIGDWTVDIIGGDGSIIETRTLTRNDNT